jgi:hypothetical protein
MIGAGIFPGDIAVVNRAPTRSTAALSWPFSMVNSPSSVTEEKARAGLQAENVAAKLRSRRTWRSRFAQDAQYRASKLIELPVASADKKAGVMLLDLVHSSQVQVGLFDAPDDARSRARMKALDDLTARYGRDILCYGSTDRLRLENAPRSTIAPFYHLRGRASCRRLTTCPSICSKPHVNREPIRP